ncbi:PotD/PotF family extracellular solute-binding protein [Nonomuraea sp. NPDC048826]|uniref:ABC transporter substrate-binding protein n=1 Tax=Nonomuraea sp. NPDC048826 TaxID=3364347 RepID=UPI0037160708
MTLIDPPSPRPFSRRGFLGLTGGLAGLAALAACGSSETGGGGASSTVLTVQYFEGAGQDPVPKRILQEMPAADQNLKIEEIIGGSRWPEILAAYKASKKALANVGLFTGERIAQGNALSMFRAVTQQEVPRLSAAVPAYDMFQGTGVPFNTTLIGLIYRDDLVEKPPTSWMDLLDPKYKGKVGLFDAPQGITMSGLWAINQALGGDPVTLDKGFEAFAKAARDGQFGTVYNSNQTQFDAFSRGDVVIGASMLSTQVNWTAQGAKIGYAVPREGQLANPLYLGIVESSSEAQVAAALKFVNAMLEPANVAEYNELTASGSVYSDQPAGDKFKDHPAFAQEALTQALQVDWKVQGEALAAQSERWNRDVKGSLG